MKKILSIILVAVMLMSCVITFSASDNRKISPKLQTTIEKSADDELIRVILIVDTDTVYYNKLSFLIDKGYDIEKYHKDSEYKSQFEADWNAYIDEYKAQNEKVMMSLYNEYFGGDTENIEECWTLLKTMIVKATKEEILYAAEASQISSIGLFENETPELSFGEDMMSYFCKEAYLKYMNVTTTDEMVANIDVIYYGTVDDYYVFRPNSNAPLLVVEQTIGDYLFVWGSIAGDELANPVGIYVTDSLGNADTLEEAHNKGVVDISKVSKVVPYAYLYGDADNDGTLTVCDATYIQKITAGINSTAEGRKMIAYTSPDDMNRDGKVNVKDATAIQKHIAGIEY